MLKLQYMLVELKLHFNVQDGKKSASCQGQRQLDISTQVIDQVI
jgi:hypothetical protein